MSDSCLQIRDYSIKVLFYNTVVVGTGAAGFNAADSLFSQGKTDLAIVTEGMNLGTSRNTGSDKQTYYKLTLAGAGSDSVREMAQTLFDGQAVDGDIALCEAAGSAQAFIKLAELGVPFPRNRYGEYVGYKTDHDPRQRATSVGPYTSKMMTECLEQSVKAKGIKILDQLQVIRILVQDDRYVGLLCLNLAELESKDNRFVAICSKNVVYATGGPAGMYADNVYPIGHYGSSGLAFEAGVSGKNLTEWQFGLASIQPRWNVSGTYMQVLPSFISRGPDGSEREFLSDFFSNPGELLTKVFLKGYQWPFDVRKVNGGSSIIDILVYIELSQGNRVYLDFRKNPGGEGVDFGLLSAEAREYLEKAGACFGTPLQRLAHMNQPAIDFYLNKGVDLATEPLEIALSAQHNNGGLAVDCWWQTNIEGFFAAGEVAASHGVYRPGGSALNAGQVGSARAARYIAARRQGAPSSMFEFAAAVQDQIAETVRLSESLCTQAPENVSRIWDQVTAAMSRIGGAIRNTAEMENASTDVQALVKNFADTVHAGDLKSLPKALRLREILICQQVYLQAMLDYAQRGGLSRGSALYTDKSGPKPYDCLPETFRFFVDDGSRSSEIQEIEYREGNCSCNWRSARPLPSDDDFFENTWRQYREHGNVF